MQRLKFVPRVTASALAPQEYRPKGTPVVLRMPNINDAAVRDLVRKCEHAMREQLHASHRLRAMLRSYLEQVLTEYYGAALAQLHRQLHG